MTNFKGIVIEDPDDSTKIARVTDEGALYVADFKAQISKGEVAGHENFRALGYNSSIGATLEDITESGIDVPLPNTARGLEVLSSAAADAGVLLSSGTATGGSATTLVDSGADFVTDGIAAGDLVLNDEDGSTAIVLTVDDLNTLTFTTPLPNGDIFDSGDAYRLVDDSAGGVGAKVVEVHALDSNFDPFDEFVILNGITPVGMVSSAIRINNFHSMFVGVAGGVSSGNIDVREIAVPANIMNRIGAGGNMTLQCFHTVPNGKVMFITDWSAGSSGNKPIRMILRATVDFSDRAYLPGVFQFQDIIIAQDGTTAKEFPLPLRVPCTADVKVSANIIGAGIGEGSASFGFWLEDE